MGDQKNDTSDIFLIFSELIQMVDVYNIQG